METAERQAPLHYPTSGLLLGSLIGKRSCLVTMAEYGQATAIKNDLEFLRRKASLPKPYFMRATAIRNDAAEAATINCLQKYSSENQENGLLVVEGVDYTGKTSSGRPQVVSHLAGLINKADAPMVLVLGVGSFPKRPEDITEEATKATHAFLAQVACRYSLDRVPDAVYQPVIEGSQARFTISSPTSTVILNAQIERPFDFPHVGEPSLSA